MKLTKNIKDILVLVIFYFTVGHLSAHKEIKDVALMVDGYKIPIKIYLPDDVSTKMPVHFYIHGGGWNGGTKKQVPPATISRDAKYLCDRLGIIYVGLAYRCKGNDGTFKKAIDDLQASVKWFFNKADEFNADLTRIGFGGSSAGSTLSAVMAQKYKNCKLYIGNEGMYNVVDIDSTLSHFPDGKSRAAYGLTTLSQRKEASAYYNLRKNPPSSLLLQGKDDWLCHYSQTQKFADKIKEAGGKSKAVFYEGINHTCLNENYPEVFSNSVLEIAKHFTREFNLNALDIKDLENSLEKSLASKYPYKTIAKDKLYGTWKDKRWGQFTFNTNGKGVYVNSKGKEKKEFTYKIEEGQILLFWGNETRVFYLRKNNNYIYEKILKENRHKSRRYNYKKIN